jgi:hypothetical protein
VIVLGDSLANLGGGDADNRLGIGVVIRRPAEDLDAECTFLQLICLPIQTFLNHIPQKCRVALAAAEMRARENCT